MNVIIFVIIFLTIIIFFKKYKEHYSSAAITQLVAKGPQDTYLTDDAWQHIPPYYFDYYNRFYFPSNQYYDPYYRYPYYWNLPTRLYY